MDRASSTHKRGKTYEGIGDISFQYNDLMKYLKTSDSGRSILIRRILSHGQGLFKEGKGTAKLRELFLAYLEALHEYYFKYPEWDENSRKLKEEHGEEWLKDIAYLTFLTLEAEIEADT